MNAGEFAQLRSRMDPIKIIKVAAGTKLVDEARTLFAHYRDFLQTIESTHCFNFERYGQEIAELPAWYTHANGDVLLAFANDLPAGCIAFRAVPKPVENTCEIKRLFVLPEFRGRGLARALVQSCLRLAPERGFTKAILDTDIVSMPAALAMYRSMGFTESTPHGVHAPSLRFLERPL